MKISATMLLVLIWVCAGNGAARAEQPGCKLCTEQRAACMKNYAGTGVQNRVSDVHEILQKVKSTELRDLTAKHFMMALATGIGGSVALDAGFVAAENVQRLTGAQIRAKFAGMQLTDEVHYRLVYERDVTLRSVEMGVRSAGNGPSIRISFACISRSRTMAAMT